jgi:hypothetical protein
MWPRTRTRMRTCASPASPVQLGEREKEEWEEEGRGGAQKEVPLYVRTLLLAHIRPGLNCGCSLPK